MDEKSRAEGPAILPEPRYLADYGPSAKKSIGLTRVVYTDLDNTLLGPRASLFLGPDHKYSLEPAKALVGLMEAGIDIVPVSGRNNTQLKELARLLGISNYIAEMGCLIFYDQGRDVLQNHSFTVPEGMNLHQAIEETGAPALLLDRFRGRFEYHTPWSRNQKCTHLFRGLIDVGEANRFLSEKGFSNLRIADNGRCRSMGNFESLPEVHAYHLLPKEAGKASAIRADCARRSLAREETIAIGDSVADLEMADAVGSFFLVENEISSKPGLAEALAEHENTYITSKRMGLGWAEVAGLLL